MIFFIPYYDAILINIVAKIRKNADIKELYSFFSVKYYVIFLLFIR